MREILYRAKAINRDKEYHRTEYKNGDWVYGLITRLYDERFENLPAEMTNTNGISGIEIDYKTIGQYTGLTDKNGTKIFEGDIIQSYWHREKYGIAKIYYDEGTYWCKLLSGCCHDDTDTLSEWYAEYGLEVISDIHDNPEFLKGAETE